MHVTFSQLSTLRAAAVDVVPLHLRGLYSKPDIVNAVYC